MTRTSLITIIALVCLAAHAGPTSITGYKKYKLGRKLSGKTTKHSLYPHSQKTKSNPPVFIGADDGKLIRLVSLSYRYKEDPHKHGPAQAGFKKLVEAAQKKHGKGVTERESVRQASCVITGVNKNTLTIVQRGPYVTVKYESKKQ